MNEESERWLAEAADRLREYEAVGRRTDDLRRRIDDAERLLAEVGREHVRQRGDVERLEHRTAIRLLASLRGTRQDDLARERAEADRAGRREEDARARLRTLRRDLQAAQVRRAELAEAPRIHAALLDEKEGRLRAGGDPRAARLAALAAERDRLRGEADQVEEAGRAAAAAGAALVEVRDQLDRAAGWSTYDTFFGGGMVSSMMKHGRLDDAARAARAADRRLAALRTELADLRGVWLAPELHVDGLTRFADIFLDNIFTDLAVRGRIRQAQAAVDRAGTLVRQVRERLSGRAEETRRRLTAIAAERADLLTRR